MTTEPSPVSALTYTLTLLYWLVIYGLAGYAVKHLIETAFARQRAAARIRVENPQVKPKRRR